MRPGLAMHVMSSANGSVTGNPTGLRPLVHFALCSTTARTRAHWPGELPSVWRSPKKCHPIGAAPSCIIRKIVVATFNGLRDRLVDGDPLSAGYWQSERPLSLKVRGLAPEQHFSC
jgi:hypothetical protein